MKEIWKDIKGYEGLYQISNLGEIKSLNYRQTGKEKIMKPYKANNGYLKIGLNKNGIRKIMYIHRLVAETFIPNLNNYTEINHNDENKENNEVNNLKWCNHKYNINYGTRIERFKKSKSRSVIQLSLSGEVIKKWSSIKEASKAVNCCDSHISKCCKGKYKSAGGYKWKYEV